MLFLKMFSFLRFSLRVLFDINHIQKKRIYLGISINHRALKGWNKISLLALVGRIIFFVDMKEKILNRISGMLETFSKIKSKSSLIQCQ